jgi:hypothetical protein
MCPFPLALAIAARNEERAFAFWSYVAAFAEKSDIKKAAEAMAGEELRHVAMLRKERRRTYHGEHDARRQALRTGAAPDQIDAASSSAVSLRRLARSRNKSMVHRPIARVNSPGRSLTCRLRRPDASGRPDRKLTTTGRANCLGRS